MLLVAAPNAGLFCPNKPPLLEAPNVVLLLLLFALLPNPPNAPELAVFVAVEPKSPPELVVAAPKAGLGAPKPVDVLEPKPVVSS